jgi:hypothetical protein
MENMKTKIRNDMEKMKITMRTDKERAMAMDKAFMMSKLFQEPYFSAIEEALTRLPKDAAGAENLFLETFVKFREEGQPEILTKEQKVWLWNYLKHYDAKKDWMPSADW